MINRRSGRRAVPPAAPLGAEGGSQLFPPPLPASPPPRPAGPPGLPAAASCRRERGWGDGRCSGWGARA